MCGFSGYFSINKKNKFTNISQYHSLKHRGPDEYNIFKNDNFYCRFYRLNIIGGTDGRQPMISKNKRFLMVFNGEIYNFKELSEEYLPSKQNYKSDTKVLLELFSKYGLKIIEKINGMFNSFIRLKKKKIYLIRDRLGTKPLYYAFKNGDLYFSSEIKGILSKILTIAL